MLQRIPKVLSHLKGGAVAGLFLVGTTGALVAGAVSNGVTTTQETSSASPSASASPSGSSTASPSHSPSSSPSSSAKANSCEQQSDVIESAVDKVNDAFEKDHETLMHLRERARTDKLRDEIKAADTLLKQIRRDAVKAIHATRTCAKDKDDEDEQGEDKDNDKDDHPSASPSASPSGTPAPTASPSPSASSSPSTSGKTPQQIADDAVAAMDLVVKTVLADFPTPSASPSHRPERSHAPETHQPDHD